MYQPPTLRESLLRELHRDVRAYTDFLRALEGAMHDGTMGVLAQELNAGSSTPLEHVGATIGHHLLHKAGELAIAFGVIDGVTQQEQDAERDEEREPASPPQRREARPTAVRYQPFAPPANESVTTLPAQVGEYDPLTEASRQHATRFTGQAQPRDSTVLWQRH